MISAATRCFALLGEPVSHSLSPAMQNAAFRAAGVDGVYVALRCGAAELPGLLRGLARAGGGGNVTLPHKGAAAASVERRTRAVERTGACNTFWEREGRVWGDNTDLAGVSAAANELLGAEPRGARILLLGAGGAAAAALCALLDAGAGEVSLANRTPERARALARRCAPDDPRARVLDVPAARERWDLVVNATSLGLHPGDPHPFDLRSGGAAAALDLVYAPAETAWVRAARAAGIPAIDGAAMLAAQGAAAFERWWGRPAPVAAMRAAVGVAR